MTRRIGCREDAVHGAGPIECAYRSSDSSAVTPEAALGGWMAPATAVSAPRAYSEKSRGKGNCQEMSVFRIVGVPGARAPGSPASAHKPSMSSTMELGLTRSTATVAFAPWAPAQLEGPPSRAALLRPGEHPVSRGRVDAAEAHRPGEGNTLVGPPSRERRNDLRELPRAALTILLHAPYSGVLVGPHVRVRHDAAGFGAAGQPHP
jgi:hypothetical protein